MLALALALLSALSELRSIALGERLTLTLPASGSGDPELRLRLVAPRAGAVTVALESLDFDPVLRIETEDGRLLAEDDDSGLEQDARLTLELDLEQRVVLVAAAKRGGGELVVWVAAGEHPTPSGTALVDLRCARYAALAERAHVREERYVAARLRFEEAHLHEERARLPEARAAFEAALLLARELGERELEAMTLSGLGLLERRLGRPARARELFERCLLLARELGSLVGEASTSLNLGNLELDAGEGARARAHFERARELARELGDQRRERKALNSLGLALESLGEHERARDAHEAALALARGSGDRSGEAAARQNLGSLLFVLGEHEAAYEHELLALATSRAPPASARLERLPGTREEAFAIARTLLGGEGRELEALRARRSGSLAEDRLELHLGAQASRARLAGPLRGYSVLHLACHGHVDLEEPARSGVALSPAGEDAGWLTIQEALELDLDCELVVLSACRTARGATKAGEGVESLARAFLYAGARGLVASLWPVDDRAAARTMEAFYDAWLGQGLAPAGALRRAKLALRHGTLELGALRGVAPEAGPRSEAGEGGHPFFWAPFVHVGLGAGPPPRER